jgi:glycosyltransferase involved in cell wall biosynthesis
MKVLLAGNMVGQGGIQSHLRWLGQMLAEEQIPTMIVSLSAPRSAVDSYEQYFEGSSVAIHYLSNPSSDKPPTSWQKFSYFSQIIRQFQPDIYLAVGTGWNLSLPLIFSGVKTHRAFHEVMAGAPNGWLDPRWGIRFLFDEVIGISPTVARTFAESFQWEKPMNSLSAVPEPLELTAKLPQVGRRSVPLGKAKAGVFSRLFPEKQVFWLVQQWDVLKDYLGELHIHGSGPEEALIRDYIRHHGLTDRVKCHGRYPEGQAYVDLLSSYDLTLLPTIGAEGAPLVLLESMACGVPFVAYGVGGIPDYGTNNPNVRIVAPEPWRTDQAKTYASVESLSVKVPFDLETLSDDARLQVAIKTAAFSTSVKSMLESLDQGEINQSELQQYYFNHYSYSVLKAAWISYLCKP